MRTPLDRLTQRLPNPARVAIDWIVTLAVAVGIVLTVKVEVANPYRIPSASMEPTLRCAKPSPGCDATFSDRVIANRLAYRFHDPHRGDIVVFDAPEQAAQRCDEGGTFVKRIVGLPGEVVSERNGDVYIDGRAVKEPYVDGRRRDSITRTWPRVPQGEYFVMGDNRCDSLDSRVFGVIAGSSIVGRSVAVSWPLKHLRWL